MPPIPPPGIGGASFFGLSVDHGFGCYQEAGNRRRVLEGDPHDLRWIDNAGADHIDELLGLSIIAECLRFVFKDLADDEEAFGAGILDDLADWSLNRPQALRRSPPAKASANDRPAWDFPLLSLLRTSSRRQSRDLFLAVSVFRV